MESKAMRAGAPFVIALGLVAGLQAQEIRLDPGQLGTAARRQHIELETQTVLVKANRPDWVELRFRVDPGFHVNSHTPHDELLLPTVLDLTPAQGVKVTAQEYPAGIPLRLDIGSGETLSTYQGEFRVRVQVLAQGAAALDGALRYQACDAHACFPPRTLPVHVALTAH